MASGNGAETLLLVGVLGVGGYLVYRELKGGGLLTQTPAPAPVYVPVPTPTSPAATVPPAGITTAPPLLAPAVNISTSPAAVIGADYQAVLGRQADPAGLSYWESVATQQLAAGVDPATVAANIQNAFEQAKAAGAG